MTADRSLYDGDLDRFEVALLGELRTDVRRRASARRRSWAIRLGGLAAAGAAAVGLGVVVGGTSPAFAVHRESDGDIVVTINRLDDADGLERALAAQGVVAEVDYTEPIRMRTADGSAVDVVPLRPGHPDGDRGRVDCGFGEGARIGIRAAGEGYVVRLSRASVLARTPLRITTASSAGDPTLAVSYYGGRCVEVATNRG